MEYNKIDFNSLKDKAYEAACEKGWHDETYSDDHYICLIISELMEAVQADRNNRRADLLTFDYSLPPVESYVRFRDFIKDSVEDELADTCIRVLDYAGVRDVKIFPMYGYNFSTKTFPEAVAQIVFSMNSERREWELNNGNWHSKMLRQIFSLANRTGTSNEEMLRFIELKMQYNEYREHKHGKKY